MVEFALLVTMVAVSLIIIMATLGNSVGTVWQAVVDSFESRPLFVVPTVGGTPVDTATLASTATDDNPYGYTATPTKTLQFTPTPTHTPTETATKQPTPLPTETVEITPIPSATQSLLAVDNYWINRKTNSIDVFMEVNREVVLTVTDYQSWVTKVVTCTVSCQVRFDPPLKGSGYITITSPVGDDINIPYDAS